MASDSFSTAFACSGPMDSTTIFAEGSLSLIRAAASSAYPSNGFRMLGTPSRISVFFTGSILISVVSGTCLTHTSMFISVFPPITFFQDCGEPQSRGPSPAIPPVGIAWPNHFSRLTSYTGSAPLVNRNCHSPHKKAPDLERLPANRISSGRYSSDPPAAEPSKKQDFKKYLFTPLVYHGKMLKHPGHTRQDFGYWRIHTL